jgi:hypothetical protein
MCGERKIFFGTEIIDIKCPHTVMSESGISHNVIFLCVPFAPLSPKYFSFCKWWGSVLLALLQRLHADVDQNELPQIVGRF